VAYFSIAMRPHFYWPVTARQEMYLYVCDIEARSRSCCCRGNAINITHCEGVSVFVPLLSGMQAHVFLRRIIYIYILSSVACQAVPCFSTLFH
jgi:hypothetical protein